MYSTKASSSPYSTKALLIRSLGSRNEYERPLQRRKDIPNRHFGQRDLDGFVSTKGRPMMRKTSMLIDGHRSERYCICHAFEQDPDLNFANRRRFREGSIQRLLSGWGRRSGLSVLRAGIERYSMVRCYQHTWFCDSLVKIMGPRGICGSWGLRVSGC